jgi:hypothetical protein
MPLIGDVLSHTISPILGRLLWPLLLSQDFRPEPRPKEVCRLSGGDDDAAISDPGFCSRNSLMMPAAYRFREAYGHLKMPVVIVAGTEDRVVEARNPPSCIVI